MTLKIIETIGKWGVKTAPHTETRMQNPRSGDIISFEQWKPGDDSPGATWFYHAEYGRIETADVAELGFDLLHVSLNLASGFLNEDGTVQCSGSPMSIMPKQLLIPTFRLMETRVWNWGDRPRGANQAVTYVIPRPLFIVSRERYELWRSQPGWNMHTAYNPEIPTNG